MMWLTRLMSRYFKGLLDLPEEGASADRYQVLRRNIIVLMVLVTIVPLSVMAFINYHQYQANLKQEMVEPLRVLVNKTKHSFELFLTERKSAVSFIATAYSYEQLSTETTLNRIFHAVKQDFEGFVDLGLIDPNGIQINYVGPYALKNKDYSEQGWYHEARIRGSFISDVFMGYRKFPHIVIAVERMNDAGQSWVLRATIDTAKFDELIASMGLDPESDAFLINQGGVLQTNSRFCGHVLDLCSVPVPPPSLQANVLEGRYLNGRESFLAYVGFAQPEFVLMALKPKSDVLKAWYSLKGELLVVFVLSVVVTLLVVFKLTDLMVRRMQESDQRREAAFREMQHSHKLSSIGRLAAGVAHEINNPLAIINEKTGLMKDIIGLNQDMPARDKFLSLVDAVLDSVGRCRAITHRLLGFARRMEVQMEPLDINEVIKEVLGFLEKEAMYRNIDLQLHMSPDLPAIESDRGQLQQVFLNIINNAFAAVEDGGEIVIVTREESKKQVIVSIQDNGCGMSEETLKHIFEPFFTTKRGYGTGLGLPITYGIVQKLKGTIEVQSTEGKGTTFTIALPIKAGEDRGE